MRSYGGVTLLATLLVASCGERVADPEVRSVATVHDNGVVRSATGGGKSFVTAPPAAIGVAEFSFSAVQNSDGTASGRFRMVRYRAGFLVDFSGEVTCMAVDAVNNRAWIGGVVVANRSNDPNHTLDIHEPGDDVWFRVVDHGEGAGAPPDRSSVYGFKGAAGIDTSSQYCAAQLWPAGDANVFELTEGNIQVRSR